MRIPATLYTDNICPAAPLTRMEDSVTDIVMF